MYNAAHSFDSDLDIETIDGFVFSHRVEAVLLRDIVSEQPYRPSISLKEGDKIMVDLETQQAYANGICFDVSEDEYRVLNQN